MEKLVEYVDWRPEVWIDLEAGVNESTPLLADYSDRDSNTLVSSTPYQ